MKLNLPTYLLFLSVVRNPATWLDDLPGLALLRTEDIDMYRSNLRHFCLPLISACLLAAPIAHAEDPGPSIVQRLQARYDDTAKQCDDGLAAFYCNGVIVRGIRDHSRPDFWNPTPEGIARDGISASYIRKDVGNIYTAGRAGFIMRELKSPDTYPVKLRCAFPTDSATAFREKAALPKHFPCPAT